MKGKSCKTPMKETKAMDKHELTKETSKESKKEDKYDKFDKNFMSRMLKK
jgi:hypothetical protein